MTELYKKVIRSDKPLFNGEDDLLAVKVLFDCFLRRVNLKGFKIERDVDTDGKHLLNLSLPIDKNKLKLIED